MRKIGKRKQLICENCGTPFSIYIEAYEKLIKEGKPIYCSVNCSNHQEKLDSSKPKIEIVVDDIETSFKYHYKQLLQSNPVIKVSLDDIKKQWEKQHGYCAISSV